MKLLLGGIFLALTLALIPGAARAQCTNTGDFSMSSLVWRIACGSSVREPEGGNFLSGFDLTFSNSRHKPQTFGVAHPTAAVMNMWRSRALNATSLEDDEIQDTVGIVLADPGAEDRLAVRYRYEPFNRPITMFEQSKTDCNGTCEIVVPSSQSFREGEFLIRGFLFMRDVEFDDNIREISIVPRCPRNRELPCFIEVKYADDDARETYDVLVQYSVLPDDAVRERSAHSVIRTANDTAVRGSRTVTTAFQQSGPDGFAVGIQRFDLRYSDRDHFLGRIAIMPLGGNVASIVMRDGDNDGSLTKVRYDVGFIGVDRDWLAGE